MQQVYLNVATIFILAGLIIDPSLSMILNGRVLGKEETEGYPDYEGLGSSGFLASMLLKKSLAENEEDLESLNYNEMLYKIINNGHKKELELLLIYMKTFQKDLSNKCKMAMLKNIEDIRVTGEQPFYMARCEFFAETIFRYLHMNILFYNVEFIYRIFDLLITSETIGLNFNNESEDERIQRNTIFMGVLEGVIGDAFKDEGVDFVSTRFDFINQFYGAHFLLIFNEIIDEEYKIKRMTIPLSNEIQTLFDWGFNVPLHSIKAEKERIASGLVNTSLKDNDFPDAKPNRLYRFYGKYYDTPLFDVKQFHMF